MIESDRSSLPSHLKLPRTKLPWRPVARSGSRSMDKGSAEGRAKASMCGWMVKRSGYGYGHGWKSGYVVWNPQNWDQLQYEDGSIAIESLNRLDGRFPGAELGTEPNCSKDFGMSYFGPLWKIDNFWKTPHLSKYSKYQQIIPDTLVRFLKIAWHTSGSGDVPHSSTMTWRSSMFSWKMTLKIEKGRFGKLQNMFLNKQTTMYDDVRFFLSISEDTSPATRCNWTPTWHRNIMKKTTSWWVAASASR